MSRLIDENDFYNKVLDERKFVWQMTNLDCEGVRENEEKRNNLRYMR